MVPGSAVTISPIPGSLVDGRPGSAAQTRVTRPTPSIQTVSGGPSRASVGTRIGNGARLAASARPICRPRPSDAPSAWAVGLEVGATDGDGPTLGVSWPIVAAGVDGAVGPNTIRRPGRPKPIAPAIAAIARRATTAR